MKNTSYPYAVSQVKALESTLINRNIWNRLAESSLEECYQILRDINYGKEALDSNNIESLTRASVTEARIFINDISPNKALTDLFLYKVDGENIKTVLKGLLQQENIDDYILEGGTISKDKLLKAFEEDNYEEFPIKLREAIDNFDPEESPMRLSANVDNAVFDQIFYDLSLKKNKNDLIKNYFDLKVQLTNIITILRIHKLNWDLKQSEILIIPNSSINVETLKSALNIPADQLASLLSSGYYKQKIEDLINNYINSSSFFKIETQFSIMSYDLIHESYADSFGIGPIINYLLNKEFEAEMLRVLFAYKKANRPISLSELGIK